MRASVARRRPTAFGTRRGWSAHNVRDCNGSKRREGQRNERNNEKTFHTGHSSALSDFSATFNQALCCELP